MLPYQDEMEYRSIEEIVEAEKEFYHKIWYGRYKLLEKTVESGQRSVDPKIWKGALKSTHKIEAKYGKEYLGHWGDFELGMISGKLSAL